MTTPPQPRWSIPEAPTERRRFVVTVEVPADTSAMLEEWIVEAVRAVAPAASYETVVVAQISGIQLAKLDLAIAAWERAADGDSNDAEHEAALDLAHFAGAIYNTLKGT
jgi:hypothetical protein